MREADGVRVVSCPWQRHRTSSSAGWLQGTAPRAAPLLQLAWITIDDLRPGCRWLLIRRGWRLWDLALYVAGLIFH
jgi:hypothetical protein